MKLSKTEYPSTNAGYTIVEVMIVLAITGLMFVGTVLLINGRQGVTQFQTASNDLQTQIQQVVTEVANGYFIDGGYTCKNSITTIKLDLPDDPPKASGKCVAMGKAIHFYTQDPSKNSTFSVYTLVGLNLDSYGAAGATPAAGYTAARMFAVAPTTAASPYHLQNPDGVNVTQAVNMENGITAQSVTTKSGAGTPCASGCSVGSLVFVQTLNNSGSALAKGGQAQHVDILGIYNSASPASALANDEASEAGAIDRALANGNFIVNPTINMCFNSGSTKQSALVTIDGANSGLSVTAQIKTGSCS